MWHRPCVESIPATENNENAPRGLRIMLLPMDRALAHSLWRISCTATCVATRLDEHAVSIAIHGPRRAKTNEMRAPAAEMPLPVISYGPGMNYILCILSEFIMPSMIPTSAVARALRSKASLCNALYPTCNKSSCYGSIGATSAGLIRKKLASNQLALSKKAAYQSRFFWSMLNPVKSTVSTSQRVKGMEPAAFKVAMLDPTHSSLR